MPRPNLLLVTLSLVCLAFAPAQAQTGKPASTPPQPESPPVQTQAPPQPAPPPQAAPPSEAEPPPQPESPPQAEPAPQPEPPPIEPQADPPQSEPTRPRTNRDPDAPPMRIGPVTFSGYIQYDYLAGVGEDRRLIDDSFRFRRVRFQLAGPLSKDIDWAFSVETTNSPGLRDAYVVLKFVPEATITIGQLVMPYGYERYVLSSNRMEFTERPLNTLAPGRDAGIMVANEKPFFGWLTYGAAIANGTGQNITDTNNGKDMMGRVTVGPPSIKGLEFSINGARGEQLIGLRTRSGGDVSYQNRRYHVAVEYLRETIDSATPIERNGFYVFGAFRLYPAEPKRGLHHLEFASRYAELSEGEIDRHQVDLAANYYLRRNLRFMMDVILHTGPRQDEPAAALQARTNIVF